MARAKRRRTHKKVAPPPAAGPPPSLTPSPPEDSFPFMSLLPEIRLMVYDSAMPDEVRLSNRKASPGLPPTIRALMRVKVIRDELIPHLFGRYHFEWTDAHPRQQFQRDLEWECFKRQVVPYINSLSFRFTRPVSRPRKQSSYEPLDRLLRWTRWRSLRPHLHPWSLKKLTLVEANEPFSNRQPPYRTPVDVSYGPDRFLTDVSVVPGLDSLRIVLKDHAGEEAVKAFLERCESCEIDGRIGYCPYGQEKVSEWFRLQDNQVVRMAG
ncbi:hypothetical protein INS49_007627 [Diaporthe citri]|uniref:uncharacterized protein n=1 Tax=Diaporthe citri TaxID=83186 RepID=UPI001C7EFF30|nr:uncharacterized protein INS49_007627 [Diaporthe citri]KAG6362535.1 hypothetical protein INS49_007627 [Diaporthe citri]